MTRLLCCFSLAAAIVLSASPQTRSQWRTASPGQLEAALPARAPVEKERIETEMRTASGIINQRGQIVAAVVLITAGYSADGKYSHYLLAQVPLTLDRHLSLAAGNYVVGWRRGEDGLVIRFFDAASGVERGTVLARPMPQAGRVESFRIWPPSERSAIQIGRFTLPYSLDLP